MWNRKLGRKADHRKALLRNMATSVIAYGQIETTEMKAKETCTLVVRLQALYVMLLSMKKQDRLLCRSCLKKSVLLMQTVRVDILVLLRQEYVAETQHLWQSLN